MTTPARKRLSGSRTQLLTAATFAFLATLLGLPSHAALDIPANPLRAGTTNPPNILFILDDSGSMEEDLMRNEDVNTIKTVDDKNGRRLDLSDVGDPINTRGASDDRALAYTYNSLYYNPRTTYRPWLGPDGRDLPAVTAAKTWDDDNLTIAVPAEAGATATSASGTTDLTRSRRKFYVLNDGETAAGDLAKYTFYELSNSTSARKCIPEKDSKQLWTWTCSSVTSFSWTKDGVTTTRTVEQEWQNYATWYGYHRTRMKAAKAGASYAFGDLGEGYRVGYRSIWQRRGLDIPVGTDNGLFKDKVTKDATTGVETRTASNRTYWFNRLFSAEGNSGTPLQGALQSAGKYFQRADKDGPWGPEEGSKQLACRQNFAILTTDGYWNNQSNYDSSIGNSDNTDGTTVTGPKGKSYTYKAEAPYKDGYSDTLGDIANYYWKTDLRDLDNIVRSTPAFWQHMVTFGISIGMKGTLTEADLPALKSGSKSWGDPSGTNDKPEKIDDLFHAAVNSGGKFVAAIDPDAFTAGLRSALDAIDEAVGSASNISFSGTSLSGGTRSYVASYVAGQWTGDVKAYPVTSSGISTTVEWSANATGKIPTSNRKVYTHAGTNGAVPTSFPTTAQNTALGDGIADYIKGTRTGEGTTYRQRSNIFGDIVNSSPVYVKEGTTETLYVGANDGMLHAIDATNGQERFTYVPALINMTDLKELARKKDFVHKFFVDGPIVVSTRQQTTDKNILVGTLGRGGKGVFGLDVTDPTTFGTSGKTWEFAGDTDMGMVLGRPQVAKINDTNRTTAVLVPNGINSAGGKAVLYVLNMQTGEQLGKVATNSETNNGLSMPTAVDMDGNGTADYAYAGDLQGNVWKFDLTDSDATKWTSTKMFTAVDPDDSTKRQPITGGITVAFNPATYNPWILFGTGRYLIDTDPSDTSVQSWYGFEDDGTAIADRTKLKARKITLVDTVAKKKVRAFEEAVAGDMKDMKGWVVDLITPPDVKEGERMIGDQFVVAGNVLVATSVIPSSSDCLPDGTGWLNFVDAFTGGATKSPFIDLNGDNQFTMGGDGVPADKNGDGTKEGYIPPSSVSLENGMTSDAGALFGTYPGGGYPMFCAIGSAATPGCVPFDWGPGFGRISWREVLKD